MMQQNITLVDAWINAAIADGHSDFQVRKLQSLRESFFIEMQGGSGQAVAFLEAQAAKGHPGPPIKRLRRSLLMRFADFMCRPSRWE